jgi:hypothetical protein
LLARKIAIETMEEKKRAVQSQSNYQPKKSAV